MTFPEPSTLRDIGTAAGVVLMAAVAVISRSSLGQLRGPKDQNGQHGKCVRDILLDVMVAMEQHTSTSELRHVERMRAFEEMRTELGRLELRVSAIEDAGKRKGE